MSSANSSKCVKYANADRLNWMTFSENSKSINPVDDIKNHVMIISLLESNQEKKYEILAESVSDPIDKVKKFITETDVKIDISSYTMSMFRAANRNGHKQSLSYLCNLAKIKYDDSLKKLLSRLDDIINDDE